MRVTVAQIQKKIESPCRYFLTITAHHLSVDRVTSQCSRLCRGSDEGLYPVVHYHLKSTEGIARMSKT